MSMLYQDKISVDTYARPEKLTEYITWLQNILEKIPEAYRPTAVVDINAYDYGTEYDIYYYCPMPQNKIEQIEQNKRDMVVRNIAYAKQVLRDAEREYPDLLKT